jgi:hypothetical protein
MIKTNQDKVVETAVLGRIAHPSVPHYPAMKVASDGSPYIPVGAGGINYSVRMGDPAFGWAWGDHVEPCVSIENRDANANGGLSTFSCIGNEALIVSSRMEMKEGKGKPVTGVVVGKHQHGTHERVLVHFPKRVMERLTVGDEIQVRGGGVGLSAADYEEVSIMNTSPRFLKAMNLSERAGKLRIPVAKIILGKIMGSGVGSGNCHRGSLDIQATSPEMVKEYSLDTIRLGDVVAVTDYDATYGARWQPGAITLGVVTHGSSSASGHGPGINVIMTSPSGVIEPIITRKANISEILNLP